MSNGTRNLIRSADARRILRDRIADSVAGPALWSSVPVYGQYPKGFVPFACRAMGVAETEVAHICSGALHPDSGAVTVDIRRETIPSVVADARNLPFRDGSFRAVLLDPPYNDEYARGLYNVEYPRPSHLLAEADRILQPGGVVGFLHAVVPNPVGEIAIDRILGIATGCGYRIRAFTILRKKQTTLL